MYLLSTKDCKKFNSIQICFPENTDFSCSHKKVTIRKVSFTLIIFPGRKEIKLLCILVCQTILTMIFFWLLFAIYNHIFVNFSLIAHNIFQTARNPA